MPIRTIRIQGLDLMATTACNLNCPGCYGHMSHEPDAFMSLETALKATRLALANRRRPHATHPFSLVFFGGEPLLNWPMITAYLDHVRDEPPASWESCQVYLVTNGLLLTHDKIDLLYSRKVKLILSLDGDYPQHVVRRPMSRQAYDRILNMIRYATIRSGPDQLTVYSVVRRDSIDHLPPFFWKLAEMGVESIELSRDGKEQVTAADRRRLLKTVRDFHSECPSMRFSFNCESAMDCVTCHPRFILVYPNEDVFDLCFLVASLLHRAGMITREEMAVTRLGKLDEIESVKVNLEEKMRIIRKKLFCPTVARKPTREFM